MAAVEQGSLVESLCGSNSLVEEGIDFGGEFVGKRIEMAGEFVFVEVHVGKVAADAFQAVADFAHFLHIDVYLHAEFLTENVDKLDGGSGRAFAEEPYVGIENVNAVEDSHERGGQAVAGGAVGVEVNGDFHSLLQLADNRCGAQRVDKAGHILERDDFRAKALHLHGFVDEILVGEDFLGCFGSLFFAEERRQESLFGSGGNFVFRIYGIANGGIGYSAEFVDEADGFLDVVDIVEGVEDTHHVETVFDGLFIETFENGIGIGDITEEVSAARKSRKKRLSFDGFAYGAQANPRRFVEVTHYRVGNRSAPYFHNIEACIVI